MNPSTFWPRSGVRVSLVGQQTMQLLCTSAKASSGRWPRSCWGSARSTRKHSISASRQSIQGTQAVSSLRATSRCSATLRSVPLVASRPPRHHSQGPPRSDWWLVMVRRGSAPLRSVRQWPKKGPKAGPAAGWAHNDLLQGTALHGHGQAETLQQRFVAGPGSKDQAAASDAQVADFDAGAVRAVMDAIDLGCPVEVRRAEAGEALGEAHGVEDKVVEPIDDALERFRTQERGKLLGLQTLRPALQHLAGQQCRERSQAAGFSEKIGCVHLRASGHSSPAPHCRPGRPASAPACWRWFRWPGSAGHRARTSARRESCLGKPRSGGCQGGGIRAIQRRNRHCAARFNSHRPAMPPPMMAASVWTVLFTKTASLTLLLVRVVYRFDSP